MTSAPFVVSAQRLKQIARTLLTAEGLDEAHADAVADVLVWADLRGVPSHGVSRLPRYLEMLRTGEMNPAANMRDVGGGGVFGIIEADRAPGPAAMVRAMDNAIARAKQAGLGMTMVRATTHTGALGFYTRRAAASGLIGIAAAASGPNMAYYGSRAAGVSTSPISIAAPSGDGRTIIFDMSTGAISLGKLKQLARNQDTIPEGLALDILGNPTTESKSAAIPMPLGNAKGSGLSLMIEIITSILVKNPILTPALEGAPDGKLHRQNALALAIDIRQFCEPDYFDAEITRLKRAIKALPSAGEEGPLLPGERGDIVFARQMEAGIPLSSATTGDLATLAKRYGVGIQELTPELC